MASACPTNAELAGEVQRVLAKIVELTAAQLEAFRDRRSGEMMRFDKELEQAMGEKERAIGAYNQHREEHGC
jgi:hypothetical protein